MRQQRENWFKELRQDPEAIAELMDNLPHQPGIKLRLTDTLDDIQTRTEEYNE